MVENYCRVIPAKIQGTYSDRFKKVETTWEKDTIGFFLIQQEQRQIINIYLFRIPADINPNEYMDAHPTTVLFIPYKSGNDYSVSETIEDSNEGNESAIELSQLNSFFTLHTNECFFLY